MAPYSSYAQFYDAVEGAPTDRAQWVEAAIDRFLPQASSLLELGCGTGSVLALLGQIPNRVGIDFSPEMLEIARAKIPEVILIEGDITAFDLDESFDVIICVYDTINHLLDIDSWGNLFDRVGKHLSPGGLFIFDVNTVGRLEMLGQALPWVHDFDGNTLIMKVSYRGSGMSDWDLRVFATDNDGVITLHKETLQEFAPTISLIKNTLPRDFVLLEERDETQGAPNDASRRAYFVAQRINELDRRSLR